MAGHEPNIWHEAHVTATLVAILLMVTAALCGIPAAIAATRGQVLKAILLLITCAVGCGFLTFFGLLMLSESSGIGILYLLGSSVVWTVSVVWSLTLEKRTQAGDVASEQRHRERVRTLSGEAQRVLEEQTRIGRLEADLYNLRAEVAQTKPVVPQSESTCHNPQCGSKCAAHMEFCWKCGFALRDFASSGQTDLNRPPSSTQEPAPVSVPAEARTGLAPTSTQELRVECRSCQKRFSGALEKIQTLRACPKCGAVPFNYEPLPAKH